MNRPMWMILAWMGCSGDPATDTTPETDTDTDTTATTGDTGTTDTNTETATGPGGFSELAWRLHENVEAMVYVSWTQDADENVTVDYLIDGETEWVSTPLIAATAGTNEQLVVGIPYGTTAQYRITGDKGSSTATAALVTGDGPRDLPHGTVETSESARWLPDGNFLLTSISESNGGWGTSGPFYAMIVDREGRPVWSRRTGSRHWTIYATVAQSGDHLLLDDFWDNPKQIQNATVHRTYLDQHIEEIATPGLHHAFVELPDGTLVWGSKWHGGGESLVEKTPGQVDDTVLWTCDGDWPEQKGFAAWGCKSNCIYYDAKRDSFLYSFYTHETVVEIDRGSGSTLWWAGLVEGGYTFDPANSQFYWQHGVSYTPAGTLLVSTHDSLYGADTNLAREYTVDYDKGVLTEIWSYDAEELADTNGDTWRLPNGNTLHTLGSASQVKEVDAKGDTVWHLDYNGTRLMGRSEWMEDLYDYVSPEAKAKFVNQ
ncbi:MAG: arylsulfotransferase family protein [Myxococcales bacterium]|nr:arylsulfotransferase family protein [Myxococcales bacterium]